MFRTETSGFLPILYDLRIIGVAKESPDLTPMDFWGYLKNKVDKTKPRNIEDVTLRIRHECRLTSPEVLIKLFSLIFRKLNEEKAIMYSLHLHFKLDLKTLSFHFKK